MGTRKAVEVTQPEVIDIPLIEDCIVVTGGEEMQKERTRLPFEEVLCLKLSFRNIVRIENLNGLHSLQRLQLDNNHIRKIENLDHLTSVTWLDLSFNQIEVIEGLDALVNISDLCLTHNKICKIENLDTLVKLEIFSIANNGVKTTEQLQALRKFEKLRVVNFQNNPVEKDPEYQPVLLAFLKHLKYLDFRLVDEAKVSSAKEQYFSDLQQLQQIEADQDKQKRIAQEQQDTAERHLKANMPGVGALLSNMLSEDMEGEKLTLFHDFDDALEDFRDEFTDSWEKYEVAMMDLYGLKVKEKAEFQKMYLGAIEAVDQKSKAMIGEFKLLKKKTKQQMSSSSFLNRAADTVAKEKKEHIGELRSRVTELADRLLALEQFQIEQYEDLIGQFEEKYGSIKNDTLDTCRLFFEKCRDLQNTYFESVKEKAGDMLTKFGAGENLGLPDEALQVLADKDAFMTGVVTGSHEFRLSKIDQKDEELTKNEVASYTEYTEGLFAHENERSRTRTSDVTSMVEFFTREIDEMAAAAI